MNENQLAYPTLRAIEPANIAELLKSDMFPAFNARILITGFSDLDDLLNSYEARGVLSAIGTIRGFLHTLFNAHDVIHTCLEDDSRPPSPRIELEFNETLWNGDGGLIFETPGYHLPTAWIHRAHGGYDQNGKIGISIGLDPEPMVPTSEVSEAISRCKGGMLLAVLPLCTSAPSSKILRDNPRILMVEGDDMGVISDIQSEDRMRSLHQLQERTNRLRGWYTQVLQHALGEDWFSGGEGVVQ
ncbi:hypothetical protein OAJ45_04160 [Candidatus Poseidoniales archaeon]|nr:hypothetical protein [Candidatus Poseidoniales archaeon]MDC0256133.1 hypothetical protein [Candidatus Poseidoniales archaeon]